MGEAARAATGRATGQGTPGRGEAQAVEELQRVWADHRRRLDRMKRAEREEKRPREQAQGSGGSEGRPPAAAIQTAGYPAGSGEGDAGESLEEDQG